MPETSGEWPPFAPVRAARPIPIPRVSRVDMLLGMYESPSSTHSQSSEADLDDLDEEDIWEAEGIAVAERGSTRRVHIVDPLPTLDEALPSPAVWSVREGGSRSPKASKEGPSRRILTASRMIPRSSSLSDDVLRRVMHQSAPVNIPNWSKSSWAAHQHSSSRFKGTEIDKQVNDDENEDEDEMLIPPHEFLARDYARSQMTSFSMLEGAGRTLKGKDLSRVRDVVMTQTGFLEEPL